MSNYMYIPQRIVFLAVRAIHQEWKLIAFVLLTIACFLPRRVKHGIRDMHPQFGRGQVSVEIPLALSKKEPVIRMTRSLQVFRFQSLIGIAPSILGIIPPAKMYSENIEV